MEATRKNTDWTLSAFLQTFQVHHRRELHIMPNPRKKKYETQVDTYHLFVDYKAAFDRPVRDRVFSAMSELGISAKLIELCSITVGMDVSEPFATVLDFGQGELFNFVMEGVPQKARVQSNGNIFQRSIQTLAYADYIDSIGHTKRDVTADFRPN